MWGGGCERENCRSGGGGEMKASGRMDKGGVTEQRWEIERRRDAGVCQVWRQRCRSQALASSSRRMCEDSAGVRCCVTNMGLWSRRQGAELRWWLSVSLPRWTPTQLIKAYSVGLMLGCVSFCRATVYLRFIFGRAACRRSRTTDVSSVTENDIRLVCAGRYARAIRTCLWCIPHSTNPSFLMSVAWCTFSRIFMIFVEMADSLHRFQLFTAISKRLINFAKAAVFW